MSCLLGVDLGISSVKVVVFDSDGALKGVGMSEYPILTPRLGYAEQDPEQWWRSTKAAVREALEKAGRPDILGTGFPAKCMAWYCWTRRKTCCDRHLSGRINGAQMFCPN